MTRNHIHCAVGLAGDEGVTSGEFGRSLRRLGRQLIIVSNQACEQTAISTSISTSLLSSQVRHSLSSSPRNVAHPILADGIPLFTSTNNVVLTSGIDGVLPPKYFAKAVRKSGQVLLPVTVE